MVTIKRLFIVTMGGRTLRTWLPDAFHLLVPNDNFHCQTRLKNAKFDLFGSEK